MQQQRPARNLVAVLGDVLRIISLNHGDGSIVQARNQSDWDVLQQHPHDAAVPERIHRHLTTKADRGDDLVYEAMISLRRMLVPRAAVALRE